MGLTPVLGWYPGERNGNPLQYSCLGQRSLVGYNPWGSKRAGHGLATKQQQVLELARPGESPLPHDSYKEGSEGVGQPRDPYWDLVFLAWSLGRSSWCVQRLKAPMSPRGKVLSPDLWTARKFPLAPLGMNKLFISILLLKGPKDWWQEISA